MDCLTAARTIVWNEQHGESTRRHSRNGGVMRIALFPVHHRGDWLGFRMWFWPHPKSVRPSDPHRQAGRWDIWKTSLLNSTTTNEGGGVRPGKPSRGL